jgi:hypothetical protein
MTRNLTKAIRDYREAVEAYESFKMAKSSIAARIAQLDTTIDDRQKEKPPHSISYGQESSWKKQTRGEIEKLSNQKQLLEKELNCESTEIDFENKIARLTETRRLAKIGHILENFRVLKRHYLMPLPELIDLYAKCSAHPKRGSFNVSAENALKLFEYKLRRKKIKPHNAWIEVYFNQPAYSRWRPLECFVPHSKIGSFLISEEKDLDKILEYEVRRKRQKNLLVFDIKPTNGLGT